MYLIPPPSSYVINDSLLMVTSLDTSLLQKVFLVLNLQIQIIPTFSTLDTSFIMWTLESVPVHARKFSHLYLCFSQSEYLKQS